MFTLTNLTRSIEISLYNICSVKYMENPENLQKKYFETNIFSGMAAVY